MAAAVARLFLARSRSEPVVIFGDYDVDGVSSTALLTEVLGARPVRSHVVHALVELDRMYLAAQPPEPGIVLGQSRSDLDGSDAFARVARCRRSPNDA